MQYLAVGRLIKRPKMVYVNITIFGKVTSRVHYLSIFAFLSIKSRLHANPISLLGIFDQTRDIDLFFPLNLQQFSIKRKEKNVRKHEMRGKKGVNKLLHFRITRAPIFFLFFSSPLKQGS